MGEVFSILFWIALYFFFQSRKNKKKQQKETCVPKLNTILSFFDKHAEQQTTGDSKEILAKIEPIVQEEPTVNGPEKIPQDRAQKDVMVDPVPDKKSSTNMVLKKAVIWSEILGPPKALQR